MALDASALVPDETRMLSLRAYLHVTWTEDDERIKGDYASAVAYLYYADVPPRAGDPVYSAAYDQVVNGLVLQAFDPAFSDKETGVGRALDMGIRMKLNQLKSMPAATVEAEGGEGS